MSVCACMWEWWRVMQREGGEWESGGGAFVLRFGTTKSAHGNKCWLIFLSIPSTFVSMVSLFPLVSIFITTLLQSSLCFPRSLCTVLQLLIYWFCSSPFYQLNQIPIIFITSIRFVSELFSLTSVVFIWLSLIYVLLCSGSLIALSSSWHSICQYQYMDGTED